MKRSFALVACVLVHPFLLASCGSSPPPFAPPPAMPQTPSTPSTARATPPAADAGSPHALAPLPDHLGEWIDAYVSSFGKSWGDAYSFSGYVALARDGKPVFAKGYGKANRSTGAVADGDTRFRIGSITKQFTAVAILQLVEKGSIRLADPLRKYLPEFPAGDRVTIHHLLSQTSGVPSYTDDEALMKAHDKPHTQSEVVATFSNKPLFFEPGSEFRYSNSNYFLLGMVIEKVTSQKYEDYLRAHVLGPAGMTRTSTIDAPDAPNTAVGYSNDGDQVKPAGAVDMSTPFAAGALRSTPNDMIRWDRALAGDALLSGESRRRMVTPVKEDYAYGVSVDTIEGREVNEHNGGIDGFLSDFARVPEEKLAVVALSNNESFPPEPIVSAIVKMALTGKKIEPPVEQAPVPFDPPTLARFVGAYTLDPASRTEWTGKIPDAVLESVKTIAITADGAHLRFKPVGQAIHEVFLDTDGSLFTKRMGVAFVAEPAKGAIKTLTLKQGGLALRYTRDAWSPKTTKKK